MIETERLVMRPWCAADVDPFHAICSDPIVMATLGAPMTRVQVATRIEQMRAKYGELYGL